jgi:hypothetical protein
MILNSPYISGSLTVTGNIIASGSITISGSIASSSYAVSASEASRLQGLGSASFAPASTFNTVSQSYATTSASLSTRVTNEEATSSVLTSASSSFATMSGSLSTRVTIIEGQDATTGSNTFTGVQYVSNTSNAISFTSTASLYTDGGFRVAKDSYVSGTAYFNNITVYGTSSIEYITSSQVDIGANIITVNTDTPAVRFGGLSVFDSGSTQLTGSIFWDSEKNHWIYSNPSGSSYNSAMLMNGPRNTGSLGDEQGTTFNALMKGQGGDHITSSQMFDDGTTVRIPGALQVTGSTILSNAAFTGSVNVTGSLIVTTTGTELQVTSTGVNLGNVITDNHNVTGSLRVSGSIASNGALTGTSATFRVSTDRNLSTRFDTNIVLSAQSDSGAPESLRVYADTFRLFTATTAVGLTERFTISNTGAATFSGLVSVLSTSYDSGAEGLILGYDSSYYNAISATFSSAAASNKMNFVVSSGNGTRGIAMTLQGNGNVGIGTNTAEAVSNFRTLQIDGTSGAMLRTGTSTYGGYVATIATADAMVISNVRNPINGTFSNTGKAASVISLYGESGNAYMTFSTSNVNNTAPTTRMTITNGGNVSINNLLYADRISLSNFVTLYGTKVVKGDAVTSLTINLASIFPEMSNNISTGGNTVGVFGRFTIFRSGACETGIFSICRNSGGSWSSGAYATQTATGAFSLGSVAGSGSTSILLSFNTTVYVMVEITTMVE